MQEFHRTASVLLNFAAIEYKTLPLLLLHFFTFIRLSFSGKLAPSWRFPGQVISRLPNHLRSHIWISYLILNTTWKVILKAVLSTAFKITIFPF